MHELGVLCHAIKTVDAIAEKNGIEKIKFLTLEIGDESTFVPAFFDKLYPVAIDKFPRMNGSVLKIETISGKGISIKEIGY